MRLIFYSLRCIPKAHVKPFQNYYRHFSTRIYLDDREGAFGQVDVVLGQPIQCLAHPGAETLLQDAAGVGLRRRDGEGPGAADSGAAIAHHGVAGDV